MSKPKDDRGRMPGSPDHGDDQQGHLTHERFVEQLHERPATEADNIIAKNRVGKHRLEEHREQHDEAEEASENIERD
jgi:hypothetical protein